MPQQWGASSWLCPRVGGLDAMLLAFAPASATLFTLIFRRCVRGGWGRCSRRSSWRCLFVGSFATSAAHVHHRATRVDDDVDHRLRTRAARSGGSRDGAALRTVDEPARRRAGRTMTLGLAVAGCFLFWGTQRPGQRTENRGRKTTSAPTTTSVLCAVSRPSTTGPRRSCSRHRGRVRWTPLVTPHGLEMIRIWQRIVGSTYCRRSSRTHADGPGEAAGPRGVGLGVLHA